MVDKTAAAAAKAAGNAAFSSGKYSVALENFCEAIEHDPTDYVLYSNRSGAYAMMSKHEDALKDAEKCIDLNKQWPKGYSRKGLALFKLGRVEEAIKVYEEGLQLEPNNVQLQNGLQECRRGAAGNLIQKRLKLQIAYLLTKPKFRKYAEDDPLYADAVLQAVTKLMTENPMTCLQNLNSITNPKVKEAVDDFMSGLAGDFEDDYDKQRQTEMKAKKEAEDKAEQEKKMKQNAKTEEDKKAAKIKEEGNKLYKQKLFDEAIKHYDEAYKLNPKDLLILNNKAAVYLEKLEYDKCIEICQSAIDRRYDVKADYEVIAKIFHRMASCYLKQKMYVKAIEMYEKSLVEDNNRHTRTALKEAIRLKEKFEKESYYDEAKSDEHKEKGNELYKLKRYPEAKKEYDEAIRRNPYNPILYSNRAAALCNLLEHPSALKDVEKALELDPKFVKAWSRKGTIHCFMKAYSKAQEAYRQGLLIDPDNVECTQGLEQTMEKILESQRSGTIDEEQVKQAMADPEVQSILSDPQFRLILDQISQNPSMLQEAMKDPKIAQGLQKLILAGIVKLQ